MPKVKDVQKPVTRMALDYHQLLQSEIIVFDDMKKKKKAMAFPRAHLIGAEIVSSENIVFNFHTHVVQVTAPSADAIYDEVLKGKVSVLTTLPAARPDSHIRSVGEIDIRPTGAIEFEEGNEGTT